MHTDPQRLLDHRSALATALTDAAWVNLDIRSISIFRFIARIARKLIPRRICNAFRQAMVSQHPCDTHVLKHNHAEAIDQLSTFLMREVRASGSDPLVDASNNLPAPRPFCGSLRLVAQAALRSFQIAFITAKEAWIVNRLAG